jgi:glycerol-3-phosphate dehydrogenase
VIERDLAAAAARDYDLIVVGGGIHGATATLEAARRGLETLLVERDDFGGATSWSSLRIVHGGLRYLQSLDLGRYRESVAERNWFMRHFPDQVVPLPCLMPLYGEGLKRPSVFALAFGLDALLSWNRNRGVAADRRLDRGRVVGPAEVKRLFPTLSTDGLLGGALWNDALMPEAPRVLIEILRWSASAGARALNYLEAESLRLEDGAVASLTARDRESGERVELRTRRVLNCAGPWCREVAGRLDRDVAGLFRPTLAFNLLLDRTPPARVGAAVSPPGQDRSYFLVPWRDRVMAGTYYSVSSPDRDRLQPDDELVALFLADLNRAAPELELTPRDILRVMTGRLPVASETPPDPASKSVVHRHADGGGPTGLVSVSGVKYTTARRLAEEALQALFHSEPLPPIGPGSRPSPASWPTPEEIQLSGAEDPALAARLHTLATEESVVHLDDLLLRRTDLGLDPVRGQPAAAAVARLLASQESAVHGVEGAASSGPVEIGS